MITMNKNKKAYIIASFVILIGAVFILLGNLIEKQESSLNSILSNNLEKLQGNDRSDVDLDISTSKEKFSYELLADNLVIPWGMVFLPNGNLLVTERPGRVRIIIDGKLQAEPVAVIDKAIEFGEGGLLGIELHPDFDQNGYVYLYYTYKEENGNTLNRVVRMTFDGSSLQNEEIIVDSIPGAQFHNGGRIKFGPDGYLYITTGDAQNTSLSQEKTSLAGKILRVTDTGEPVSDNPFGDEVYSYGHRNPQGITWDDSGNLWSTEHGRSGNASGYDELNLIIKGANYGWPDIEGDKRTDEMLPPILHSGPDKTWAPGGVASLNNSLYFVGLRGSALYKVDFKQDSINTNISQQDIVNNNSLDQLNKQDQLDEYNKLLNENKSTITEIFKDEFGRIRDIVVGPDNNLYIATSNLDGRGKPNLNDDKIFRVIVDK